MKLAGPDICWPIQPMKISQYSHILPIHDLALNVYFGQNEFCVGSLLLYKLHI